MKNSIWYEFSDSGSNDPVEVFIHGNSAPSMWLMDTVNQRKRAGKATLVFDLPGHGKSDIMEDYYLDTMISALTIVLDDSGVANDERGFNIIGWSYGGNIATQALGKGLLSGLKNLVLVSSPPINLAEWNFPKGLRDNTYATEVIENNYNLCSGLSDKQVKIMAQSFLCHHDSGLNELFIPEGLLISVISTKENVRSDIMESFHLSQVADEITILDERKLDFGLHFMYGINDALVNPEYIKEVAEYVGANSCIGLPTGHAAMLENPVAVKLALDECFTKNK